MLTRINPILQADYHLCRPRRASQVSTIPTIRLITTVNSSMSSVEVPEAGVSPMRYRMDLYRGFERYGNIINSRLREVLHPREAGY